MGTVSPLDDAEPRAVGPFVLVGRLGGGEFGDGQPGSVYLATAPSGLAVAVKVVRLHPNGDPEVHALFRREAEAARGLESPSIAAVLDVDVDNRPPYVAFEYVEGPTLAEVVRDRGPLSAADTEHLARSVANALATVHAAGIVHRALGPAGIVLSPTGPRVVGVGAGAVHLRRAAAGAAAFAAPEHLIGKPTAAALDVYTWGSLVLFAGTGQFPHGEGNYSALVHRSLYQAPDLAGLRPELARLVGRALAKDAAARPTAAQLAAFLTGPAFTTTRAARGTTPGTTAPRTTAPRTTAPGTTAASPASLASPTGPASATTVAAATASVTTSTAGAATSQVAGSHTARHERHKSDSPAASSRPGTRNRPTRPNRQRSADQAGAGRRWRLGWLRRPRIVTPVVFVLGALSVGGYVFTTISNEASEDAVIAATATTAGNIPPPDSGVTPTAGVARPAPTGAALAGHHDSVRSAAVSINGKMMATVSDDRTVLVWDVTDINAPRQLAQPLTGHNTSPVSAAFSLDGAKLATASTDSSVVLWRITDPTAPTTVKAPVYGTTVAFSPNGTVLATGGVDTTVVLWNVTDLGSPEQIGLPLDAHSDDVTAVAFSPDGSTLATASADHTVALWDVTKPTTPRQLGQPLRSHNAAVLSVAFSPDSKILATASADQTVILWDVADPAAPRQLGHPLTGHGSPMTSVAFSSDGSTLAAANDVTFELWDVATPAVPRHLGIPLPGHSGAVTWLSFLPGNNAILATASADGTVLFWNLAG